MPWRARTIVNERLNFIAELQREDASFSEVCRRFGISRRTGYKWQGRYEAEGPSGLESRPSIASECPHKTPPDVIERLVALRKEHPTWGPKKLRAVVESEGLAPPAASTVGELLKRYGLVRPRRRRPVPPRLGTERGEAEHPNDIWCIDFKGHFALGDRSRCYPLTLSDAASRYLLKCEGLFETHAAPVRLHVERAFREFGLPWRIRSDNGPPFATMAMGGLSELAVWWIRIGITPERTDPGHPEQNGRHERMHRTLKAETATEPAECLREQQRIFDQWRHCYNDVRPHEALEQRPPCSRYSSSTRVMPATERSPEYPATMKVRRLDERGRLRFANQTSSTVISRWLAREPVGLEEIDEDTFHIWYGPLRLACVTLGARPFTLSPLR
jgi:transposase InsO family protein